VLGFTAMVMGLAQTEWIPNFLGSGFDPSFLWVAVVLLGLVVGAVIGGITGYLVAYIGIPSFIVTLGGLLIWRGAAFQLAKGRTIAPARRTFQLLGGGPTGSLGATLSWLVAGIAIVAIVYGLDVVAPPPAAVRLPAPAALGRHDARRRRQRCGPVRRLDRQQLPVADHPRPEIRHREQHPDPARRPARSRRDRRSRS
jgi:hypothetical protein